MFLGGAGAAATGALGCAALGAAGLAGLGLGLLAGALPVWAVARSEA